MLLTQTKGIFWLETGPQEVDWRFSNNRYRNIFCQSGCIYTLNVGVATSETRVTLNANTYQGLFAETKAAIMVFKSYEDSSFEASYETLSYV